MEKYDAAKKTRQNKQNNNNTAFWNIFSNMVGGEVYDRMKIL